jgi:hypothetical protein
VVGPDDSGQALLLDKPQLVLHHPSQEKILELLAALPTHSLQALRQLSQQLVCCLVLGHDPAAFSSDAELQVSGYGLERLRCHTLVRVEQHQENVVDRSRCWDWLSFLLTVWSRLAHRVSVSVLQERLNALDALGEFRLYCVLLLIHQLQVSRRTQLGRPLLRNAH